MRRWLAMIGAAMALLGAALPSAAAQAATPFVLQWQAPEGCPALAEVEREIASALSHLPGRGAVEVMAEVTPRDEEPGFRLRVRVQHAGSVGERVLPIDDCADTSRAAALLVALSVENPPPAPPPPVVEERKVPPPPPPPRPPWSLGVGPRLGLGIAPEVSVGVGASFAYSRSFWRLSLRGAAFAKVNHTLPSSELGGSFRLLTGGVFACAGYPGDPLTFYGCIGGRFDHLRADGFGATQNFTESTQIASPAAGITLEWNLTRRFRLRTELEAGYPLGEARFVFRYLEEQVRAEQVHEVDSLRGEAGLELAVVF